jgi:transposase-like protein
MPTLTPEAWAQIRADYEHTDRSIEDICAAHGISSGTLRDRVRRWDWTRRRRPIPAEGPPPIAPPRFAPVPPRADARAATLAASDVPADPAIAPAAPDDPATPRVAIVEATAATLDATPAATAWRLQGAVARVLPAIETTLATLTAGATPPREMERAARALGALTRTLRELNALLVQHPVPDEQESKTLDEFRANLMRKMDQAMAQGPQDGGGGA